MAPDSPQVWSALRKRAQTLPLSDLRSDRMAAARKLTQHQNVFLCENFDVENGSITNLQSRRHFLEQIISDAPCRLTTKHSPGARCIAARSLRDFTAWQTFPEALPILPVASLSARDNFRSFSSQADSGLTSYHHSH